MHCVLQVENVSKSFGSTTIVENVSLEITPGTIFGLVGLNGAGKTTLIRLLLGLLHPDRGTISVLGSNPWNHKESFYSRIGVVLENDGFWGNLTIKDNLKIYAAAKNISWRDALNYLEQFWADTVILKSDKKVKLLSRGQRMQCAICRAFMGWPEMLFLDEPAVALDMTAYDHFKSIALHAHKNGAGMIISSHQLETIDDLCERVGNLENRKLFELGDKHPENHCRWIIRTDNDMRWHDLLVKSGCTEVKWIDGTWMFDVRSSDIIPMVLQKLVYAGCMIKEVREYTVNFSETIRTLYNVRSTQDKR